MESQIIHHHIVKIQCNSIMYNYTVLLYLLFQKRVAVQYSRLLSVEASHGLYSRVCWPVSPFYIVLLLLIICDCVSSMCI